MQILSPTAYLVPAPSYGLAQVPSSETHASFARSSLGDVESCILPCQLHALPSDSLAKHSDPAERRFNAFSTLRAEELFPSRLPAWYQSFAISGLVDPGDVPLRVVADSSSGLLAISNHGQEVVVPCRRRRVCLQPPPLRPKFLARLYWSFLSYGRASAGPHLGNALTSQDKDELTSSVD